MKVLHQGLEQSSENQRGSGAQDTKSVKIGVSEEDFKIKQSLSWVL